MMMSKQAAICCLWLIIGSAASAQELSPNGTDFLVDWQTMLGKKVRLTGTVTFASTEVALLVVPGGHVQLSPPWADREDLRYLLKYCTGFTQGGACSATVTGEVGTGILGPSLTGVKFTFGR